MIRTGTTWDDDYATGVDDAIEDDIEDGDEGDW